MVWSRLFLPSLICLDLDFSSRGLFLCNRWWIDFQVSRSLAVGVCWKLPSSSLSLPVSLKRSHCYPNSFAQELVSYSVGMKGPESALGIESQLAGESYVISNSVIFFLHPHFWRGSLGSHPSSQRRTTSNLRLKIRLDSNLSFLQKPISPVGGLVFEQLNPPFVHLQYRPTSWSVWPWTATRSSFGHNRDVLHRRSFRGSSSTCVLFLLLSSSSLASCLRE